MYSYGPQHMAGQKQDDQLEHTFSSYVRIRDVALKTCKRRWTIGSFGERGSGISVLAARHDDLSQNIKVHYSHKNVVLMCHFLSLSLSLYIYIYIYIHTHRHTHFSLSLTHTHTHTHTRELLCSLMCARIYMCVCSWVAVFHLNMFD